MQPFYTGITLRSQLLVIAIGIAMLLFILNLVRKKQLREQYSLLWILSATVLLLSAVFIRAVDQVAHLVGIYYPPAFLFLIAILVVFALQFHFSTVISSLREQNKSLTQDLGILASEVRELRHALGRRE
ncbi:MAG: hypothetical protein A2W00_10990 [Candidatus Eisenbacteria bacterium RBG_16_71_46]|nr:MAG: hypothetical protein A2W00_10990 [Candidatus Eisenbacteria bacterium RBG_16_71_46]OGF23071.1 MAG: hypothetical protein A2V63_09425 [Candidatus Eisenbacteria bacterium RBG_19FT_COMBO_70_11]